MTSIVRRSAASPDIQWSSTKPGANGRLPITDAPRRPSVARARRGWSEEIAQFRPGLVAAAGIMRLLPENTAGRTRAAILRLVGVSIGRGTVLAGRLHLGGTSDPRSALSIGDHGFINVGCRIDASAPVIIGDSVYLSQDVLVLTGSHLIDGESRRAGALTAEPVSIGDGCWVGARAIILPGIEIGHGSIVAAGAVVIDDVPPNTLVAGVPARPVRSLAR